ncbi:MAG TPA: TetR/AcrR family transcriptional regulator [Terriglobales bacterium]|nr:TetR/AcrR family transcriptional regulator [Terriglobales bacterium]
MPRTRKSSNLEPQQVRSRESLRKLLKAANEVLGQRGLEGTTIPRIADHAGLTPGAVYRRFRDKEALLEAAILGILERQDERMKGGLTPEKVALIPLPVFTEQVVGGMVTAYRANASLLRAMRMFARTRRGTPFWRKASRLERRAYERAIDLFLAHRERIRHPDPRQAVSLALFMLASSLYELMEHPDDQGPWKGFLPKDEPALKKELVRAFLSYLGAGPRPA